MWKRNCPECNKELFYNSAWDLKDATLKNRFCRSCSKKGTRHPNFGKKIHFESNKGWFKKGQRPANADFKKGKTYEKIYGLQKSQEINEKLKKSYNKDEDLKRRRIYKLTPESGFKKGMKPWNYGLKMSFKNRSQEAIRNYRLSSIERIKRAILKNGQISPNYNPKGCQYFNQLMEQTNTFIQHAENGGEFYIKEIGYWVDGYDQENNIVYEWDEKRHFRDSVLKEKDVRRQKEIEEFLRCDFIRIKELDIPKPTDQK